MLTEESENECRSPLLASSKVMFHCNVLLGTEGSVSFVKVLTSDTSQMHKTTFIIQEAAKFTFHDFYVCLTFGI